MSENQQQQKASGFGKSIAKTADHIVGDLFLGTVGQVGYHLAQVPVVGTGLRYVGENIADGYNAAEERARKRKMANALVEIAGKAGGVMPNAEMLAQMAPNFQVSQETLDEIRGMAEEALKRKSKPTTSGEGFPAPAVAG